MDANPQILLPTWILLVIVLPNHFVIQMANSNSNTFDICKQGQECI
jgi:hypothetical protein